MLRILGVAVAAVVLLANSAQGAPLSRKEYIARVNEIGRTPDPYTPFNQLANQRFIHCRLCGGPRDAVPHGTAWLRKEREFRTRALRLADRLQRLTPPKEIAGLHVQWLMEIRSCVARLDKLVSRVPSRASEEIYNASSPEFRFERSVARAWASCEFDAVEELYSRGYSFG